MTGIALFFGCYFFSLSFRRTVIFWRSMLPIYAEYKWITKIQKSRLEPHVYEQVLDDYYHRTATHLVTLMTRLGGMAIKIGQVLATIGQGLLPDPVVVALRVLHDGVPAKSHDEIVRIFEASHGKDSLQQAFSWFDPVPLGAASIAQVHLARLRHSNETVVVKIQYPEVQKQLSADLWNMEMAVTLISPENKPLAQTLRERHARELDFRNEAAHLRECTANMQAHGLEPRIVRIPRVYNQTGLCNKNILVMEYLEGVSLQRILSEEQERLASAMGQASAADFQRHLSEQLKGAVANTAGGAQHSGQNPSLPAWMTNPTIQTWGARLFRTYANFATNMQRASATVAHALNPVTWAPSASRTRNNLAKSNSSTTKINLARVLKTLVHVHGLQMLMDGVFNADPHPGNVLVMPDGRLGLLDYGMVSRFSDDERSKAVETVLALANKDVERTARIYTTSGYKAQLRTGGRGILTDPAILHRFATFHWDRIDLSPVTWASTGQTQDIFQVLQGVIEPSVPKYIEEGRRLGALLMGPHIQTGRLGFSLASSWKSIAEQAQVQLIQANITHNF